MNTFLLSCVFSTTYNEHPVYYYQTNLYLLQFCACASNRKCNIVQNALRNLYNSNNNNSTGSLWLKLICLQTHTHVLAGKQTKTHRQWYIEKQDGKKWMHREKCFIYAVNTPQNPNIFSKWFVVILNTFTEAYVHTSIVILLHI